MCRSARARGRRARIGLQFRVDVFDLFNHPNFGPPGNIVGSPTFGKITRTRLPTGEAGSSRQIQLAGKCRSDDDAANSCAPVVCRRADVSRIAVDAVRRSRLRSASRSNRVLAIHWGAEDYPATPVVNDAIRKALQSRSRAFRSTIFAEYLESDVFPAETASQALREYIRRKYRGRHIDVVIAIADPALRVRAGSPRRTVSRRANRLFRGCRPGRHQPRCRSTG